MHFKLRNFDIDKFNRDVNQSLGPDAQYERWSAYRARAAEFIAGAVENEQDAKSAVVFGAGNLNDLDMRFLCGRFERITLTDADIKSMADGLARQGLSDEEKAKVELIGTDYTGAHRAGFFRNLESLAKRAAPSGELTDYIKKAMPEMQPDAPPRGFDVVISCPVYTQLVYTQIEVFLKILHEYGLYELGELNKMLNAAYSAMPHVLAKYNDTLLDVCEDGGRIILLTDAVEMPAGGALLKKAYKLAQEGLPSSEKMDKYIKKHGIEIALSGLRDFDSKTQKIGSFYAIWPFSGEKEYLVCGVHAENAIL